MGRTTDSASYALKRDEFLDAAERLLGSKGFDKVSVQDLMAATGASKGAFYHYFTSKQDLLEALAERMADTIAGNLSMAADVKDLPAPDRLSHMFAVLGSTKLRHRETIIAMLRVWYSDDNAAVRQRLRGGVTERIAPLLTTIMMQGVGEGTFDTKPAFGRVLAILIQDLNDELGQRFLQSEAKGDSVDRLMVDAEAVVETYTGAMERILGAAPGSVQLVNPDQLRTWFQPGSIT